MHPQVTLTWRKDLLYTPFIETSYCYVNALSPSPDVVRDFELTKPVVYLPSRNELTIAVKWSKPESTNGIFREYELCLFLNENATSSEDGLLCHSVAEQVGISMSKCFNIND